MTENKMRRIRVAKIVVNMGVGQTGEELKKAMTILEKITNSKPVQTLCKIKQPTWNIREGLPIGTKVTLRGEKAIEFLKTAFLAKENALEAGNFDERGNFGFGIAEHIDMPNAKYDPKLGIRGFDVLVTLERAGYRIKRRKRGKHRITKNHIIAKNEAIDFIKNNFGVEIK
ncbi:MAG: 50S ribosomal protein L5 [Candidatus Diapherotrites archaeon]|uniref:Large ribosomal subunit protein uL5 n=1 Tax=Candidatus Iainarchaeum sp. TaxID=3101447 RepID=A0A8T4KU89_9ARCH|nr:50S ribosomal protein L5 [Candidatus Diapherotrites archaeon]